MGNTVPAHKSISVIAYHRPDYLAQCLAALGAARGLGDWRVTISIDGPPDEDTHDCYAVAGNAALGDIVVRERNLGIHDGWESADRIDHPSTVIQEAFDEGSQFHLYLEEDALLGPDALEWLGGVRDRFDASEYCWLVNLADHELSTSGIAGYHPRVRITSPWAWATSAQKWSEHIGPGWNANTDHPRRGFDWSLSDQMIEAGAYGLAPNWARAYNIGRERGVHGGAEWYDANLRGMAWSGERK